MLAKPFCQMSCEIVFVKKTQTNRKTNLEVGLFYKHSYYLGFGIKVLYVA